jgi:DNA-binding response OmpR family regulator
MSKQVLIVEDDQLVADHLAELVRDRLGCEPIVSETLDRALTQTTKPIDFCFLDVKLSDGLSFSLASRLRDRSVPFVFISASDPKKVPPDLASAMFLRKPVAAERLLDIAKQHL